MEHGRSDQRNSRPGMDQVPGGAGEQDQRVGCPSSAGDEMEIHAAEGGQHKAEPEDGIEDQDPAPAGVHAPAFPQKLVPGPSQNRPHPAPMDCQVDHGRGDHRHPAYGMKVTPDMAGEKDLQVVIWVAPSLKTAIWQVEEIDPGERRNQRACEQRRVDPPVFLSLFGYSSDLHL